MRVYKNIEETKQSVLDIIKNPSLTYEQQTYALAKLAENQLPYPDGADEKFFELYNKGIICDLDEGHAPYAPRYILPDYDKLLREGCKFLRLKPAETLTDAINTLLVFYHHVPSITRFPVYLGRIDKLLDPFIKDEEQAREQIKWFLIHLDRTINDSFSHANLGPEETLAGNIIIDLEKELQDVTPNLTLLYDKDKTSNKFAVKCAAASLVCANPAFANDKMFREDFHGDYGIASCYNGLPICGGAFTLSRLRLNKIAENSESVRDFFDVKLPEAVDAMAKYMESKIRFLVEQTPFFKSNFLVTEGFIKLERFVGLFGMVGMHECVNKLMELDNKKLSYGKDKEANELGVEIVERIKKRVENFRSKYGDVWDHKYMLHSQVGADHDEGTTPGMRIATGEELPLYDHLKQAGMFHKYFPSGIGDHFPFDHTANENPQAVVDIFNGAFAAGMRYISAYPQDGDLIRVTGYLVKKSDLVKFNSGKQVSYDTIQYAQKPLNDYKVFEKKVRSVTNND